MNYQSTHEFFDTYNFHDGRFINVTSDNETVTFNLEYIYLSEHHPLNPFDVAKSIGPVRLTFQGVKESKGIIHEKKNEQHVPLSTLTPNDALAFKQKEVDGGYLYEMLANDVKLLPFCTIHVIASGFTIEWDTFGEDAWYVGWDGKACSNQRE
ncbi:hypothetical protein FZW96_07845 [Bacillus sp. BGMRC 2118]|nr:hypothetical protein FZW96_07845 [Bacillus sp. BGMRC 2118]